MKERKIDGDLASLRASIPVREPTKKLIIAMSFFVGSAPRVSGAQIAPSCYRAICRTGILDERRKPVGTIGFRE